MVWNKHTSKYGGKHTIPFACKAKKYTLKKKKKRKAKRLAFILHVTDQGYVSGNFLPGRTLKKKVKNKIKSGRHNIYPIAFLAGHSME